MKINFGNVSDDYAKFRDELPTDLFQQFIERGIEFEGRNAVDLGSGTGIFSRALARQGSNVVGIESSRKLIEEAVAIDRKEGLDSIKYVNARAEDFQLTNTVHIFTAVRAWHWFDRMKVIQNIKKYIEMSGYLIIVNSIFLPDSEIAKLTFETLVENNIELKPAGSNAEVKERRNGFPMNWFNEWQVSGFELLYEWQQQYMIQFTHEQWCGKIRSVSWMTNANESTKKAVTNQLLRKLSTKESNLNIPHKYSVIVLKYKKK